MKVKIAHHPEIADYIEGISGRSTITEIVGELTEVKLATQNEFYMNKKSFEELAESLKTLYSLILYMILSY